jgi:hypothetical protein
MANAAQAAPMAMKQVIHAASTRTIYPVAAAKCPELRVAL